MRPGAGADRSAKEAAGTAEDIHTLYASKSAHARAAGMQMRGLCGCQVLVQALGRASRLQSTLCVTQSCDLGSMRARPRRENLQ